MLNQIELYRQLPHFKDAIKGFIDETRGRLIDCHERSMQLKYHDRLTRSDKALEALRALARCLDE